MPYGREGIEWNFLVDETERFLIEHARIERTTSYTELNAVLERRTGYRRFDFDQESERAAIGAVLGEVALRSLTRDNFMLSAIVIYLNANDAGPGFYRLAATQGQLATNATAIQREAFWTRQLNLIYARYGRE